MTFFLCGTCHGEVRETTGFFNTGHRVVRNSKKCECCKGQPFRGCPDRRNFHVEGQWIGEVVERWLTNPEFRSALDRKSTMSESDIGMLRYRLGGDHIDGAKFWAFSKAVYKLQRGFPYLGDFQRITGMPASDHLLKVTASWAKGRQEPK